MKSSRYFRKAFKAAIFLLALTPISLLLWKAYADELSANPIADITHETGIWTLRFLMITLSITPLRKLTGWNTLQDFRKMTGLFAFFYGCLHLTTYIWLDQFFQWSEMLKDIAKRPFIMVGFASFVLLIPLAITSLNYMIKKLGGKRWKRLHRLVYVAAIGGVIHYLWLVKADRQRPIIYAGTLTLLLGYRVCSYIFNRIKKSNQTSAPKLISSKKDSLPETILIKD